MNKFKRAFFALVILASGLNAHATMQRHDMTLENVAGGGFRVTLSKAVVAGSVGAVTGYGTGRAMLTAYEAAGKGGTGTLAGMAVGTVVGSLLAHQREGAIGNAVGKDYVEISGLVAVVVGLLTVISKLG